ncbi:hypothetical protein [Psychroflexus sp. ALD_RP9]|uniref:hypothetical protein n=1 Tax=Psychroflexus sp. ALD_RP9 TaxID=2777186 RepID=UPI001A8C68BC|nr:hypothetical protein [Psychroflexus sp. ALD_RP9]QSS98027.1 hypothetical protein IMZ30_04750 [Psychroflexus sp. ALD_RP9]
MKKADITRSLINVLSKKVSKNIIVFESDDWGAIRMPSNKAYNKILSKKVINDSPYARFDSIATENDWHALLEVLTKFKDKSGNYPIITQNFITSNPDFNEIRNNNYKIYSEQPFFDTIKNQSQTKNYLKILDQAISSKLVKPQFHGNQHVNISKWLRLLQNNDRGAHLAFEQGTYFIDNLTKSIFATYDYNSKEELSLHYDSISKGLKLFREYFGFNSDTMIFPNYIWSKHHLVYISKIGVKGIQGTKIQNIPRDRSGYYRKLRFNGFINSYNQIDLVRNCFFEPSSSKSGNTVEYCIKSIDSAFKHKVPAIISTHRLNFIGRLNENNRTDNLIKLKELLNQIMKLWPDVVFMSSDELVKYYLNNK